MKTVKIFIVVVMATLLGFNISAFSQNPALTAGSKTMKIKVAGNCEMCKSRIEKSARVDGVSKAEWDVQSKILTVTFDTTRITILRIGKLVAAAGHDNDQARADDKVYNSLPGCCQYRK